MSWKKSFIRETETKMEEKTPHLKEFETEPSAIKPQRRKIIWASSLSLAGAAALIAGIVLGITQPWKHNSILSGQTLVSPTAREIKNCGSKGENISVSAKTAQIYQDFVKNFVPLLFKDSEASSSFSVPDAFVNVALLAYTSSDLDQKEILGIFGNPTVEELNTAVKELTLALATPHYQDYQMLSQRIDGGFSVNSVWLDPSLTLSEDSPAYFKNIQDYYFASVYHDRPTNDKMNQWLKDAVPSSYPEIPTIQMDGDSADASVVSSYFLYRIFPAYLQDRYKQEYESKSHYLPYTLPDMSTKNVDYLYDKTENCSYYLGTGFKGGSTFLGLSFYLPDEGIEPYKIMGAVSRQDYQTSQADYLNIKVPYYRIENKLNLIKALKEAGGSSITSGGSMSRLVKEDMFLSEIKQFSLVQLDYSGFYAASVTVSLSDSSAYYGKITYDLTLDRPFVFTESMPVCIDGSSSKLPVIFGQVIDPGYQAA
jgi:serine protease inhibitor